MTEQEKIYAMCIYITKALCLETNATKAVYKLTGLKHNPTGEDLGNWEITIKKVSK